MNGDAILLVAAAALIVADLAWRVATAHRRRHRGGYG